MVSAAPKTDYLALSFDKAGIRDSQKRLKDLIQEVAIAPLTDFQDELLGDFDQAEEIVRKRIAAVIVHWCEHKHDPVSPGGLETQLSDITNAGKKARKTDETLGEFYADEVKNALHQLAPDFHYEVVDDYTVATDELEFLLLELEERAVKGKIRTLDPKAVYKPDSHRFEDDLTLLITDDDWEDDDNTLEPHTMQTDQLFNADDGLAETQPAEPPKRTKAAKADVAVRSPKPEEKPDEQARGIILTDQKQAIAPQNEPEINVSVNLLNVSAEDTWHMIYGLMGYTSDYIQQKMLPRWQQEPDTFDKDRRFLYSVFLQAIRNVSGVQVVSGSYTFADRNVTVDQLWNHYFTDLSQRVGPQLAAARLDAQASAPWHKKFRQRVVAEMRKISPLWLLALVIALVFDGLTTYVSLDQTPMDGIMVWVFTALITALFQIADMLVIDYRKREFDADALIARYRARQAQLDNAIADLDTTSDSFVQLSMERSKAHADWKAAEDNRKMARRGRYWSARIADINVVVTAYGFAYLFLNAEEPMYALYQQFEYIFALRQWEQVNLWVFLMIGLAVTVSFVINTAQRTEILGWSMRRLKNEA